MPDPISEPSTPSGPAVTTRTPPEVDRVAASRAAVAARRARAAVKSQIAEGARSPLDVLREAFEQPEGVEGRLRVTEFLTSIPAIGVTKSARIMHDLEQHAVSGGDRLVDDPARGAVPERVVHGRPL